MKIELLRTAYYLGLYQYTFSLMGAFNELSHETGISIKKDRSYRIKRSLVNKSKWFIGAGMVGRMFYVLMR